MSILHKIKIEIVGLLNDAYGRKIADTDDFVYPPDARMGDLSLPCFRIAKELGKTPGFVAQDMIALLAKKQGISSVMATGPYLNFILDKGEIAQDLFRQIAAEKENYGKNTAVDGKRIMIEYSNANTHKEYHIGHLRNLCFGDAIVKILASNGNEVIPVSYINDFGIHAAKTLWAYMEFYNNQEPADLEKGAFLGEVYVRAAKELENNEVGKRLAQMIMKKIESRQGAEYELWQKTRIWSIAQMDKIYQDLDVKFVQTFYENEVVDQGLRIVVELLKKGIARKSQGAIIVDLEKYGLGVMILQRSDGTALYPVADLSLAQRKFDDYRLDESIYIVDQRQSLNFKQLFKVLELWGYHQKMIHLGYDVVRLPSGMMSSRSGNVITYEDLKKQALTKAEAETAKRHTDWSREKISEIAWKIVKGAIKFEMLKTSPSQIITFDVEQALKFEGFTAAYLQYTYARINSILRKAETGFNFENFHFGLLNDQKENDLILQLAKYPEIIKKAGADYDPSEIAKYLSELARSFNDYYHAVPILKAEEGVRKVRLVLLQSVSQIIANGLGLLGVGIMEEM
jgi:arginyl-tRNA synthetase